MISIEGTAIDCRISTLPSLHGEKVVIRLLTRGDDIPSLSSLGFEPRQLAAVERSAEAVDHATEQTLADGDVRGLADAP